jgi:DNA-binding MarR family transcriptional regulator
MDKSEQLTDSLNELFVIFRRRLMGNFFIYARDNGLTMAQFGTLMRLLHRGACGVSDIGNDLGVTNSAASQMLERLVQVKLITRTEDPSDRRVKQIIITDRGREILSESNQAFQAWMEDLARSMTKEEQEQAERGLSILIDKAHELEINKQ